MQDLISRQAAIEILEFGEKYFRHLVDDIHVDGYEREKCEWGIYLIETYIAGMKDLPSAQPDVPDTNVGDTTHKNVIFSPVQMAMDYAVNATDFSASSDTISRQAAIEALGEEPLVWTDTDEELATRNQWERDVNAIKAVPSVELTLYGYNIEHLELIARVLQKENLPPERVVEALTDIGRIIAIVQDEFEESLRKASEQCVMAYMQQEKTFSNGGWSITNNSRKDK